MPNATRTLRCMYMYLILFFSASSSSSLSKSSSPGFAFSTRSGFAHWRASSVQNRWVAARPRSERSYRVTWIQPWSPQTRRCTPRACKQMENPQIYLVSSLNNIQTFAHVIRRNFEFQRKFCRFFFRRRSLTTVKWAQFWIFGQGLLPEFRDVKLRAATRNGHFVSITHN